jgi:hypothetical protein
MRQPLSWQPADNENAMNASDTDTREPGTTTTSDGQAESARDRAIRSAARESSIELRVRAARTQWWIVVAVIGAALCIVIAMAVALGLTNL